MMESRNTWARIMARTGQQVDAQVVLARRLRVVLQSVHACKQGARATRKGGLREAATNACARWAYRPRRRSRCQWPTARQRSPPRPATTTGTTATAEVEEARSGVSATADNNSVSNAHRVRRRPRRALHRARGRGGVGVAGRIVRVHLRILPQNPAPEQQRIERQLRTKRKQHQWLTKMSVPAVFTAPVASRAVTAMAANWIVMRLAFRAIKRHQHAYFGSVDWQVYRPLCPASAHASPDGLPTDISTDRIRRRSY